MAPAVRSVRRAAGDFQQPVTAEQLQAICERAFGSGARPVRAVELEGGTYNSTYRVEFERAEPVILRVAPVADRPGAVADAMRNEHAAAPYLAGLGALVPRTLAADFSHQLIDRDYLVQTMVPGIPAHTGLAAYPAGRRAPIYRQLGVITRALHDVRGPGFGRPAGPVRASWSDELAGQFEEYAGALAAAGLELADARQLLAAVTTHRAVLDEITEPRLLHGDLWTLNLLVADGADEPTITGVLDWDAARWGDPLADWTIHQVRIRTDPEVAAFWDGYGPAATGQAVELRQLFYQARNLLGARLDIHRRGIDLATVPPVHWDLAPVLAKLSAG